MPKLKGIPVVYFKKGQNKEEVAGPYLQAAAKGGKERVVMIGIAPEHAVRRDYGRRRAFSDRRFP